MAWDDTLTRVQDVLADLYPTKEAAIRIVRTAGMTPKRVGLTDVAFDTWHNILAAADEAGCLLDLLDAARRDYPERGDLRILAERCVTRPSGGAPRPAFVA